MKKESDSLKRLKNIQSEVSSHYFIKNNGKIVTLVPFSPDSHASNSSISSIFSPVPIY